MKLVKEEWSKMGDLPAHLKIKFLKPSIKCWNVTCYGNTKSKIKNIENEIMKIDVMSKERELNLLKLLDWSS